ncbi:Uncharacterised protein [Enterobacter hormaechei]|nr:hypothetical protein AI2683V1_0123 [Enterobacter cloacae]CZZ54630.1 Uncharacterised protein [Enterobacter hormaechei]CAE7046998.1 hypothetical protein AI2696V1_0123 [Enterobacter cloacae]CAE7452100.1 hypothetical protein AI2672V1_0123 [Enterobacter cloacae]CAE7458523.1 hypothetical protein AI2673V1_0123 [Enterobacter cloacae]
MGGMRGNTTLKGITRLDLNVDYLVKYMIFSCILL